MPRAMRDKPRDAVLVSTTGCHARIWKTKGNCPKIVRCGGRMSGSNALAPSMTRRDTHAARARGPGRPSRRRCIHEQGIAVITVSALQQGRRAR